MLKDTFETRVIPLWHLIIFAELCFVSIPVMYVFVRGGIEGLFSYGFDELSVLVVVGFFGSLFFLFLYSVLFSKLKVDEYGISHRLYHKDFDKIDKIKLKWGGRLLVLDRIGAWFLLRNPEEFTSAIKSVKPEILSD